MTKTELQRTERLGQERINKQGYIMRVIEYDNYANIIVKFQDEYNTKVKTTWNNFNKGSVVNPTVYKLRLGEEKLNHQGYLMKIVEYNSQKNIVVEFQDEYKARVNVRYDHFTVGDIKNPYHPNIYNVGMVGNKCPVTINGAVTKEYRAWREIIRRCFDEKLKEKYPSYQNVTCCSDWLYYEKFYEWLHSQENFDEWLTGKRWEVDKDIILKGNKIYSPETCFLVPHNVNCLFIKSNSSRGEMPIGVVKRERNGKCKYEAHCNNPLTEKLEHLGEYLTPEDAFYLGYKPYKENLIKQVAEIEYSKGTISKKCYDAMMNYEVEITD